MRSSERIGQALGRAVAPVFEAVSEARRARTFHPRGDLVFAHVEPALDGALPELARALEGPAFARFSSALSRQPRWPDVLGCGLGFTHATGSLEADQHLLFATIRRPWTMPFAPFTTHVNDYLSNVYFAVSPFAVEGRDHVYVRLVPLWRGRRAPEPDATRRQRLAHAVDARVASLVLEAASGPWGPWQPVVTLEPFALASDDPPGLELDPFLDGRGLVPQGFVHALRRGAYAGSRRGRERAA